jgi:hypothetical protein
MLFHVANPRVENTAKAVNSVTLRICTLPQCLIRAKVGLGLTFAASRVKARLAGRRIQLRIHLGGQVLQDLDPVIPTNKFLGGWHKARSK